MDVATIGGLIIAACVGVAILIVFLGANSGVEAEERSHRQTDIYQHDENVDHD